MGKRRLRGVIGAIEPLSGREALRVADDFGGPDIAVQGTKLAPQRTAHEITAERQAQRDLARKIALQGLPQHVVPEYARLPQPAKPVPKPFRRRV